MNFQTEHILRILSNTPPFFNWIVFGGYYILWLYLSDKKLFWYYILWLYLSDKKLFWYYILWLYLSDTKLF